MSVCLSSAGRAQRREIRPDSEVLPRPLRGTELSSFTSPLWPASAHTECREHGILGERLGDVLQLPAVISASFMFAL